MFSTWVKYLARNPRLSRKMPNPDPVSYQTLAWRGKRGHVPGMKTIFLTLSAIISFAISASGEGKASAEWLAGSIGKEIRTVIRMKIDSGWHTYWENPGEGGLPLSIEIELPEGWKAAEISYPTPVRFMTGEARRIRILRTRRLSTHTHPARRFRGRCSSGFSDFVVAHLQRRNLSPREGRTHSESRLR